MATRENYNILRPLADAMENFIKTVWYNRNPIPNYIEYKPIDEIRVGNSLSLKLGRARTNDIYLNINQQFPHTLVVGNTGQGKSNCIKSILASTINNYPNTDLYLLDFKAVELNIFKNVRQCKMYEYDSDKITESLEIIYNLIQEKYQDMMMRNQYKANVYDKTSILIVEEISIASKKDIKILQKILAIARAVNFYVIITTQRPSCDIISPVLKSLISNIICFKTSNKATSVICIEQEGAEELECIGRGYFKNDYQLVKFQSFYISDEVLNEIIENNTNIINTSKVKSDSNDEEWLNKL